MHEGIANVLKRTISYVTKSANPLVMQPFYDGASEWAGTRDELWFGLLAEAVAQNDGNAKNPRRTSQYYEFALGHFWRALNSYMDGGLPHTHPLCVSASLGVVRCGRFFDGKGCELLLKEICAMPVVTPFRPFRGEGERHERRPISQTDPGLRQEDEGRQRQLSQVREHNSEAEQGAKEGWAEGWNDGTSSVISNGPSSRFASRFTPRTLTLARFAHRSLRYPLRTLPPAPE